LRLFLRPNKRKDRFDVQASSSPTLPIDVLGVETVASFLSRSEGSADSEANEREAEAFCSVVAVLLLHIIRLRIKAFISVNILHKLDRSLTPDSSKELSCVFPQGMVTFDPSCLGPCLVLIVKNTTVFLCGATRHCTIVIRGRTEYRGGAVSPKL
jgi:hypothetical protein